MNKAALIEYQSKIWPAACKGQGWDVRDKELRRAVRRQCLLEVGSPWDGDEVGPLPHAEVTALFVFHRHLAEPNNITAQQRWTDCKADYRAFNVSKQADYWQEKAGGGRRFVRNRFKGRTTATPRPFADEPLTLIEAEQRRLTMKGAALAKNENHPF